MRAAYDISHLNHSQLSGVGIYTLELLKALRAREGLSMQPVYRLSRFKSRKYFRQHIGDNYKPWMRGILESGSDVLHGPDFRVSATRRAKRVSSIMDLAFLEPGMTSPEFAAKKKRDLDRLLDDNTPDILIAISEATRDALVKYRPALADRVHVTLLGGDHMKFLESPMDERLKNKPYFLFVGNLEARKNVLSILSAFESFCRDVDGVQLVLIGKPGFEGDIIAKAIEESPARSRILMLGYCSQADLQAHYRNALALVYPSWIEGFGIPVVEAMQLRCPVITSATTSTAEIAGDTGWLVDPADRKAILNAMLKAFELSKDTKAREVFLDRAEARAKTFTWARCAQETHEAYKKALNSK